MRELIQFEPARAKKKTNIPLPNLYTEQKIDGERYLIHSYEEGNYCTSRRQSVVTGMMVEKTDRVPHLMSINLPQASLFDTEFVSSGDIVQLDLPGKFWDKMEDGRHARFIRSLGYLPVYPHVGNTVSIMGSLANEAIRKQEERGKIWAYCFDIIMFQGQSLGHNSQIKRRNFLRNLSENIDPESGFVLMPAWHTLTLSEIEELFYLVTDIKGEGLILKDPTQHYNAPKNWYKMKRDFPADVVYTGRCKEGQEGKTGKMLGKAASLEIGVYHNNSLIPIGWVSAIRDGEDNLQTPEEHAATWTGRAIEIRHNGLQKDNTLRHPRFRRVRDDKNPTDCTFERLKYEVSTCV